MDQVAGRVLDAVVDEIVDQVVSRVLDEIVDEIVDQVVSRVVNEVVDEDVDEVLDQVVDKADSTSAKTNSSKETPAYFKAIGKRDVGVAPGRVFTSIK